MGGVSFDEAFGNAMRGAVQVLSGHGPPQYVLARSPPTSSTRHPGSRAPASEPGREKLVIEMG